MVLSIGDVAERTGLRASAIRFYEERGLLPVASRKGGRRVYDSSILDRLAVIQLAKLAGFTIAEIGDLMQSTGTLSEPATAWRALAEGRRADLNDKMTRLEEMKRIVELLANCECSTLAECGRAFREAISARADSS